MQWQALASRGQCPRPAKLELLPARGRQLVQLSEQLGANYCGPLGRGWGGRNPTWAACSAVVSGSGSLVATPAHCPGAAVVRQHRGDLCLARGQSGSAKSVPLAFHVRQDPVCRKLHVSWRAHTPHNCTLTTLSRIPGASQVPRRISTDICDPRRHCCSLCQTAKHTIAHTAACGPGSTRKTPGRFSAPTQ